MLCRGHEHDHWTRVLYSLYGNRLNRDGGCFGPRPDQHQAACSHHVTRKAPNQDNLICALCALFRSRWPLMQLTNQPTNRQKPGSSNWTGTRAPQFGHRTLSAERRAPKHMRRLSGSRGADEGGEASQASPPPSDPSGLLDACLPTLMVALRRRMALHRRRRWAASHFCWEERVVGGD